MNLVIVESPTKARKLSTYLGKEYQIEASVGHIRDLPKSGLNIDVDKNFEPTYAVMPGKKQVISKLTDAAAKADKIYLATDPDREGEAIAWHVKHILQSSKKVKEKPYLRATFHEITKAAVLAALANPTDINDSLVDAQQARRVVDRLVGYQVSPVLWKKIRRGLSAGRVQSVAMRLVVEREREIEQFVPEEYWELDVALSGTSAEKITVTVFQDGKPIEQLPEGIFVARVVELNGKKYAPKTEQDVVVLRDTLPDSSYTVTDIEKKERKRSSLPPFTTSTLQQAAANRLGFSSKQTMSLAQNLYEEGLITYHRTDSINLSSAAIGMARTYIDKEFGERYVPSKPRVFANKSKNAQEAHEAIRVTDVQAVASGITNTARLTERHVKLYDLIWRRFVASQMSEAVYDQTTISVEAKSTPPVAGFETAGLRSSGSVLKFDGWMRLFQSSEDTILPAVTPGQSVGFADHNVQQKFTQPPPRYNDASLVKELESRGIGRPSTYASIISVIEERGYVEKQQKRFFATDVGKTVSDFLVEHFPDFMEYEFTAEMEEDLDRISRGEKDWHKVVKAFYTPFNLKVEKVTDKADRVQIPVEKTGEVCPECGAAEGGEIVIRTGRFGKFRSCSRFPECKYTQNIVETVEGVTCPLCQKGDVVAKQSRWGKPFFGCGRYPDCSWASWSKPQPGEIISAEDWAIHQQEREERKKKYQERREGGKTASAKKATGAKKFTGAKKTAKKKPAKKSTKKKATKK